MYTSSSGSSTTIIQLTTVISDLSLVESSTKETPLRCNVCRDLEPALFDHQPKGKGEYARVDVAWHSLQTIRSICQGCALLDRILRRFFQRSELHDGPISLVSHHTIRIQVDRSENIIIYSPDKTPWNSIKIQNHLTGWTDSEESLDFIKKILQLCEADHELCRPREDAPLSTRLLDLGVPGSEGYNGTIKPLETGNTKVLHATRYACLSHCWGKSQLLKTILSTIEEHKVEIQIAALPRTFSDAVDCTRRMGIRYIWIDSLCIIQDDVDGKEWKREAAQMSDIYQNCVLCLGATNSTSGASGLYAGDPVRTDNFHSSTFYIASTHTAFPWSVSARREIRHAALADPVFAPDPKYEVTNSPGNLRTRSWVYQERMLAPRFVHFLEQEIAWECRTGKACECGCQCDVVTIGTSKAEFATKLASTGPAGLDFWWRQMVVSYINLNLTYETDRLPALAGTARVFEEKRREGTACYAEVWSDSVVEDLSWQVWDPGAWRNKMGRSYTRTGGVPTWSWASVSAPIMYDPIPVDKNEALCEVVDMGARGLISGPSDEELSQRTLVVRGYLVPATVMYEGEGRHCKLTFGNGEKKLPLGNDVSLGLPGLGFVPTGETVHCLSLVKSPYQYRSLVFIELDEAEGYYQRIGVLRHTEDIFMAVAEQSVVRIR